MFSGYGCETERESETIENMKHVTNAKPPRHASITRHNMSSARLLATTDAVSLPIRQLSEAMAIPPAIEPPEFIPIYRSGSCAELGSKPNMEDEHVCIDDLSLHLSSSANLHSPGAFYGVFDGHGGTDAASFVRNNILNLIIEDPHFPLCLEKAIKCAFLKVDYAFADENTLDISSGTTALTAIAFKRTLIVANAGDCRAVLGRRGQAIELSRDHKPNSASERVRIERLGGVIYDGYLNGRLSVARAIGDWHMKGPKGAACPLSAEPELHEMNLTEDDEFLIMACDGLWDVMNSQGAVTLARKELMLHNDPERCARELVRMALKRKARDNLTVIVVCFTVDPPPRVESPVTRVRRNVSAEGLSMLKGALDCV